MKQSYINTFVCEGEQCGSPTYAHVIRKWIFESNKFETRVVCGGCGHIQSREYSEDLINGKIKPPISTPNGLWVYDGDSDYEIWKALMSHDCRVGENQYLIQLDNSFFHDYRQVNRDVSENV